MAHKESKSTPGSQSSRRNKKRILLLTTAFVVVVLIPGVIALGFALDRHASNDSYCESLDPTGCSVEVEIYNDTNTTYVIKQCSGSFHTPQCKAYSRSVNLQPSQSQKASGTSQNDPPQLWMVADQNGKTAGCVDLHFTKYVQQPVIVPLSKLISCQNFL